MDKKYIVRLDSDEREHLQRLVSTGKAAAYKHQHAQILLKAGIGENRPGWAPAGGHTGGTGTGGSHFLRNGAPSFKKTSSNRGKSRNGASHRRPTLNLCVRWKTCWRFTSVRLTPTNPWYAWMKAASNISRKFTPPSRPKQASPDGLTPNMNVTVSATCSCSLNH